MGQTPKIEIRERGQEKQENEMESVHILDWYITEKD